MLLVLWIVIAYVLICVTTYERGVVANSLYNVVLIVIKLIFAVWVRVGCEGY